MPFPQVNDRIKEAPVAVLRAVFAGVGQLLLAADKVRARATEHAWPAERTEPDHPAKPAPDQQPADGARNGTAPGRDVKEDHSAVRTVPTGPGTATTRPVPAARSGEPSGAAAASGPGPAAGAGPATEPGTVAAAPAAQPASGAGQGTDVPPLPGYDELSLASLRARLRALDAPAINAMLAYERAHAHRDPVIGMLERRLEKISSV